MNLTPNEIVCLERTMNSVSKMFLRGMGSRERTSIVRILGWDKKGQTCDQSFQKKPGIELNFKYHLTNKQMSNQKEHFKPTRYA